MRAVSAKALEPAAKHEEYPPGFGGGSALLDTYLQYIGENVFGESATVRRTSKTVVTLFNNSRVIYFNLWYTLHKSLIGDVGCFHSSTSIAN